MYNYEGKLNLPVFYKKRFLSIFPMFWLAWISCYLIRSILDGGFTAMAPMKRLLFTFLGIDNYVYILSNQTYVTWALVGEWFLGLILIFYILFPLLYKGILEKPVISCIIAGILFIVAFFLPRTLGIPSISPAYRLPEFFFGMIFIHYFHKVRFYVPLAALGCILVLAFLPADTVPMPIQVSITGCASFLILCWIGSVMNVSLVKKFFSLIAKYSYAIFLVHHFIINRVEAAVTAKTVTSGYLAVLFVICMLLTAASAAGLFWLEKLVMLPFKKRQSKKQSPVS